MMTYAVLAKQPYLFKNITGVSPCQFDALQQRVAAMWAASEQQRLDRPDRQRSLGGGRQYALNLGQQLLMTLMWRQLSLNTAALAVLFEVDKSTVSRNTRRMSVALSQLGDTDSRWPPPPHKGQGKGIEQVWQAYPTLQAMVAEGNAADQSPLAVTSHSHPPTDLTQMLAQTPPFHGLSEAGLQTVTQTAVCRHVERHAFFYHQGDPATTFYILVEGQVRLTEVTPEGQQLLVRFARSGEAIGIIAAMEQSVYPLAAQALEDCLALAWDSATLEGLMQRFPQIAINGLRLVSRRWHELEERYRELATERVERRIAQTLLRLVHQVGRKVERGILIDLPLTRQNLAEMTGTTLYTVSRIISRWEDECLVETSRERLLVRYPHGLTLIAEDLPRETPNNSADFTP